MSLEAALARLQNAEHEAALGSLLDAWRASGDGRTADAIDRLSARLNESEPPIVAVGNTSGKKAWYALADAKRPASLERLIEALPDGIDRVKRLEALLAWPPDPRLGTAAKRWIEDPPVHGKNRPGFFKTLWTLIEYTRDARLAPLVASIGSTSSRPTSINRYGLRSWTALVELSKRYAALPTPAPLSKEAAAVLDRIEALLATAPAKATGGTTADEAELYDRVYRDPNDDAPRIVLADLLQQRNDPRGEFIALQIARVGTDKRRTSREKKLEQQWGRTWLGPLEPCLLKDGLVFERGFPTRGRYDGSGSNVLGAREWSTFTHLDVSHASQYVGGCATLLLQLGNLRHITGLAPQDLARLEERGSLPWETVGFRLWTYEHERLTAVGNLFPVARTLILGSGMYLPLNAPLIPILSLLATWTKVKELELETDFANMAGILESPRGKQLTRLVAHTFSTTATLEDRKLSVALRRPSDLAVEQIATLIRGVVPSEVVLDVGDKKATLDGEALVTRHGRFSFARVIAAAQEAAIPLHVRGVSFPP